MKLFGKRKHTTVVASNSSSSPQQKPTDADELVQELLQQDPSSWNSKQKRMVKRYRERNAVKEEGAAENTAQLNGRTTESEKKESEEEDSKQNAPELYGAVEKLLEKLNSKQRRKITRMMQRNDPVHVIQEEVQRYLEQQQQQQQQEVVAAKNVNERKDPPEEESSPKKKRRRKVDWEALPPEERHRREEQRRLQKEAAERRADGEIETKHRHALNSERRRANRRKPAYVRRSNLHKQEHNSSGYHMRHFHKNNNDQ